MGNVSEAGQELYAIRFLIFSSHKTATQSIVSSLNSKGIRALHGHTVQDLGLQKNQFKAFLQCYREINGRKLEIISIFRDPLDRMKSSMFQALTRHYYAWTKEVDNDAIEERDPFAR